MLPRTRSPLNVCCLGLEGPTMCVAYDYKLHYVYCLGLCVLPRTSSSQHVCCLGLEAPTMCVAQDYISSHHVCCLGLEAVCCEDNATAILLSVTTAN
jgi:hypothetical protein